MQILTPSVEGLQQAAAALKAGLLVAFPTETVYGLGGDAFNPQALERIFAAKGRPRFDPLIIHIAALDTLDRIAAMDSLDPALRSKLDTLGARLWPGPLTVILPKQSAVPALATSDLPTVAVRFPAHETAQQLIRLSTGALAAPSANPFGYLSPTQAAHVQEQLGDKVAYIIDGGPCGIGVESTVLDLSADEPCILRPGGIPQEQIQELIGPVAGPSGAQAGRIHAPGQLPSHYAPRTALTLHGFSELLQLSYDPAEAYLFFDRSSLATWVSQAGTEPEAARLRVLSATGDLREAAARLFAVLHELDKSGASVIRAQRAPETGLGAAINDRLSRAAAPPPAAICHET
jgi:L-threonylcarbamoyladenylate synthase